MIILAIETSCDETAASVVEDGRKVLSHVLASSAEIHTKTGGIIPEVAAREQLKSIVPVIEEALKKGCGWVVNEDNSPPIDAIAVTYGPGLIGSLLVGVETAKTLAYVWNKPLVPTNHLTGHIYANFIDPTTVIAGQFQATAAVSDEIASATPRNNAQHQFPALALVISGGHTDLILIKNHNDITWIGGTRDDAAGEAFDKTARLLGLPYPGGPAISRLSDEWKLGNRDTKLTLFPRPLVDENNYDWSFSGLKTAVARELKSNPILLKLRGAEFAAQIQEAIVDSLVIKLIRAVEKFKPKSLLLGGGVAANHCLREKLQTQITNYQLPITLYIPPPFLCTDNASMIAAAAFYHYNPVPWDKVDAKPELTITGGV